MSDTTKLRAIQEALDAQSALELDGLDSATRTSAEQLARVDAWLRARPEPIFDDPEGFAARVEAHLGDSVAGEFDPLAIPDFSDFGDASDFGDVDAESARVVSIAAARGAAIGAPSSGATSSAVTSVAASAAPAATEASASRATGGASISGGSAAPRVRGWWFASAAVVLLAASGTFVAFRSASSPESVASSPAYDMPAAAESVAFAPGAPTAEPAAPAPMDDALQEEATRDLAFARERAEGAQNRAGRAVGGASSVTDALDGPTEPAARARPRTSPDLSGAPSMASAEGFSGDRRGLDPWASEVTETTPATAASPRMTTSTLDEALEDEENLVRIERWRARVLSCVPTNVRTLTTRVESRNGRVSAILGTSPTLDPTARGCVETALRGAPLDGASATLRWKREL